MTETVLSESNPNVPARNVLESLYAVIDPELGFDIVRLGMVYGVSVARGHVSIEMTLTTPGCPLHASIRTDVEQVLARVPGVDTVNVELVWNPPWTPDAISPEVRRSLGVPY